MSGEEKPRLLLLFTSADHPQRDAVCATLAWLAAEEGSLFETYYDSAHTGDHFGGGHPGWFDVADLRGPTVVGGRHIEALYLLASRFACEAVCLGPTLFDAVLGGAGVRVRAAAADVATLYREMFRTSSAAWPATVLVIGDADRPQGIPLTPYAFPEVVGRRALAVAGVDEAAVVDLTPGADVKSLWLSDSLLMSLRAAGVEVCPLHGVPVEPVVAAQTEWMARRWHRDGDGFLIGDPELVARWTATAVRNRWTPLYGIPQLDVINRMSGDLASCDLAHGRQYHDDDFFRLSQLGVGFQVLDPGSPPFPVVRERPGSWPAIPPVVDEPSEEDLLRWADEKRVVSTLLFWTGMIRELESVYPLADVISLTGVAAGLVLTTESFAYMSDPPLTLVDVPRERGGLHPLVELLLTDTGEGVLLASEAPAEKFASALNRSVDTLAQLLGSRTRVPKGWWAHMDAHMLPGKTPRVTRFDSPPHVRLRYHRNNVELREPQSTASPATGTGGRRLRRLVRDSPLKRYFAPIRPYEETQPGPSLLSVLTAVREAGFDYAVTKAAYGPVPRVVTGCDGMTVINHTAGRWDGWSPFFTVNSLGDLIRAERALLRRHRPGWLLGALDTCLWAFPGPLWERGTELAAMCRWVANGGRSGRMINTTPATVARYAKVLADTDRVSMTSAG